MLNLAPNSFSARLRELCRARALSLRKLDREVGVTPKAFLRSKKDEVTPTRGKMIELSRFFEVEPAWLAWGVGARRNRLKPSDLLMQLERGATKPSFVQSVRFYKPSTLILLRDDKDHARLAMDASTGCL